MENKKLQTRKEWQQEFNNMTREEQIQYRNTYNTDEYKMKLVTIFDVYKWYSGLNITSHLLPQKDKDYLLDLMFELKGDFENNKYYILVESEHVKLFNPQKIKDRDTINKFGNEIIKYLSYNIRADRYNKKPKMYFTLLQTKRIQKIFDILIDDRDFDNDSMEIILNDLIDFIVQNDSLKQKDMKTAIQFVAKNAWRF